MDNTSYLYQKQQAELDFLMLRLYAQQGDLEQLIDYINECSGLSLQRARELMPTAFVLESPTKEQYREKNKAIISLFKEYDTDDVIRELLEQSVLALLSQKVKATVGETLTGFGIDRCLSCSTI